MASRRTSAWRRRALSDHVRGAIDSGTVAPGERIPSLRSLGATFGLSAPTVLDELQHLIGEGLLVSLPGTGLFVAESDPSARPVFALVAPRWVAADDRHYRPIRLGFEETVSELGGATLSVVRDDLDELVREAESRLAGVVTWVTTGHDVSALDELSVPQVRISTYRDDEARSRFDTVEMDNLAGGRIATQHLLRRAFQRIAHLALHPDGDQSTALRFSADRLAGWRDTLEQAGRPHHGLAFQPIVAPDNYHDAVRLIAAVADEMVERRDEYDAVVASDDNVVLTFADAWHRHGLPDAQLPPIVGFEGIDAARRYVTSSVTPQWQELGEHAARLVWSRHRGTLTTPPVHRLASMRFVARITAEADWLVGARGRFSR